ncbi:MAG: hypothetical protein H0T78_06420 [Longispora sp.]|nr:hypothetical protein [Longispora sp. (in: high G+C Gram-positive bacteria)]
MTTTHDIDVPTKPGLSLSQLEGRPENEKLVTSRRGSDTLARTSTSPEAASEHAPAKDEESFSSSTVQERLQQVAVKAQVIASDRRAQCTAVGTLLACGAWIALRQRRRSRHIERRIAAYLEKKWR